MPIEWDPQAQQVHLHNGLMSLVMRVRESGRLDHVHIGAPLAPAVDYGHLGRATWASGHDEVIDPIRPVLPTRGSGDPRVPGLDVFLADGSGVLELTVTDHRIGPGKPILPGSPATYVEDDDEADTVEVDLRDERSGLVATVTTTIFRDLPVLTRSVRVHHTGTAPIALETVMSAVLDLPDDEWVMLSLTGEWGREAHVTEAPLVRGRRSLAATQGSSGHRENPFLLLRRPATTEATGEAIAMSLVYSGNHLTEAEVDAFASTRLRIGIEPDTFRWVLGPGETFQAPEAVITWSDAGIGAVSDALHRLYRERLVRGAWRDRPRPVLLNSWESVYFDFDERRIVAMAEHAADLGAELFVLDDGWFGERDDDTTSLGDWTVDARKLPSGLPDLIERVRATGLDFGIWIEPEMISQRSRLFEAHPEWAIGVEGRAATEIRHQRVLDMSNPAVVDHLETAIGAILGSGPIAYVKWDMNRVITEPYGATLPPERQGEFFHRYVLGVYELLERLTRAFPDILFESCAGGGGRFDAGMLAFAPQAWTSDSTDAVERQRIQWGTSMAYPLSAMAAHVGAVPSHQVGRVTPIDTRAAVAFFGSFGYELDPAALDEDERARVRNQIAFYRAHRDTFQRGRFVRLRSPFAGDSNETGWLCVAPDGSEAIVGWFRTLAHTRPGPSLLPLRGLDAGARYRVTVWPRRRDALVAANEHVRGGDELMAVGLLLDDHTRQSARRGDFQARLFVLERLGEAG